MIDILNPSETVVGERIETAPRPVRPGRGKQDKKKKKNAIPALASLSATMGEMDAQINAPSNEPATWKWANGRRAYNPPSPAHRTGRMIRESLMSEGEMSL